MDELRGIAGQDGIFLRREALKMGVDDKTLRRAVRFGVLVRIRTGAYAFLDGWSDASEEQRHLMRAAAVMRSARCGGVLSHTTAALAHGLEVWDLPLETIHLSRTDHKAGRREAGVTQHRGLLAPTEIVEIAGQRCTNVARTVLDVTTITDVQHGLVPLCSALHRELTTREELEDAVRAYRQVPGSLRTDLVLQLADGRLDRPGEVRTWYALWREQLPMPEPQFEVYDAFGSVFAKLDFAWPERRVWLEFDGRGKYVEYLREGESAGDAVFREKQREDRVRLMTGWICVRITWADLARPDLIAQRIRAAFAQQQAVGVPSA